MVKPLLGYILIEPIIKQQYAEGFVTFDSSIPTTKGKIIALSEESWTPEEYDYTPDFNVDQVVIFLEHSAIKLEGNYVLVHERNILGIEDGEADQER